MSDPFGGNFDPRIFEQVPLFRELAKVMSWTRGPVNWDLARQTAGSLVTAAPTRTDRDAQEFAAAVGAAELWLDQITGLAAVNGPVRSLSGEQWVREATSSAGLGQLVEPLAAGMSEALSQNLPEQMQAMGGQPGIGDALRQSLNAMGAMMYGVQVGTIAGNLAGQLLGTYDLGMPVLDPRIVATVGDTHERFARDYDVEPTEMRYWLALRESVFRRMYAGVPWLRPHLTTLLGEFATAADFNPERLMEQFGAAGIDPSNMEALSSSLGGEEFAVEPTAEQRRVLDRLQALIAFVEAYAEVVVNTAAGERLGALGRIEEAMRRRRAERGPGEQVLHQLIGLDLLPRQVRDAHAFCTAVIAARGQAGLDRVWQDPAYLPTGDDFSDPSRWLVRMAAVELDQGDQPG
ncbi:MAG TPA: zinc-dependent metalloprotease [Euzebyales bacterium]|nr:zinc-dependent metalloprotease [Euzebyales bacterium]